MAGRQEVRERKKMIIEILRAAGGIRGEQLIQEIIKRGGSSIKKNTLTDNINGLRKEGFNIESTQNGGYILKESEAMIDASGIADEDYEPANKDTAEQWLLLLIFEKEHDRYMSVEDIHLAYEDMAGKISDTKLRTHLAKLEKLRFISKYSFEEIRSRSHLDEDTDGKAPNKRFYHISENAPVPGLIYKDDLMEFNGYYSDRGYDSELKETLKAIRKKIAFVSPETEDPESGAIRTFGRKNDISDELTDKLDFILSLPFKELALNIRYREKDNEKDYCFKTALIVFSVETNSFYLIGEAKNEEGWSRIVFRPERVVKAVADKNTKNDIYESRKYKRLFRQMWSVVTEEPTHVEVWFEDMPYIKRQIDILKNARAGTAKVSYPVNQGTGGWIKYKDDIIGVDAFMRFVRGMGSSAVIIEPARAREHMIKKTEELLEKYKELHEEYVKGEQSSFDTQE